MDTHLIFPLVIFMVSFAGIPFLLIEILMWVMGRLDNPRASKARREAIEPQLVSTLSVQAKVESIYPLGGHIENTIESIQSHYPQASAPLFQFSEALEDVPCQVCTNVHPAAEDTWMSMVHCSPNCVPLLKLEV